MLLNNLQDKVVLITGATGGLGSVVTREFARTEARLALNARSEQDLSELILEIGRTTDQVLPLVADVTETAKVESMIKMVIDKFGRVDVLLNTVGGWRGGKFVANVTDDEWQKMLTLNLHSAFLLSRAVLPHMLENGWGRIVHISSKGAIEPRGKQVSYAVAKMGVITLTEVIAAETKGTGVTANVILPSIIDTAANRKMMPKADTQKWVSPKDIARMMRFLCSEYAASINGARVPMYAAV